MYIPKQFRQEDEETLIETIRAITFGALIIFADNRFFSSHIPFLIKRTENNALVLEGHVAKANEIWQMVDLSQKAMVIFQGSNAYIHPGWYPAKAKTGKVVPTWNYNVVHCHGHIQSNQSEPWLLQHLKDLTEDQEKNRINPWHIHDAPREYIQTLTKGIVGIQFHIEKMEGAEKMNQHHPKENRLGVIEGLSKSSNPQDQEVCKIMQEIELNKDI